MLLSLILLPAAGGCLEFLLGRPNPNKGSAGLWAVAAAAASLVLAIALTVQVAAGEKPSFPWMHLRADALGAIVALLTSFLGLVGLAYARRHLNAEVAAGRARAEWLPGLFGCSALFMGAAHWAALSDHLIVLYIAVEATTLATILPVAFYRRRTSWEATYKYLLLNTIGLTAGLLGLAILYAAAEPTLGTGALSLSALAAAGPQLPPLAAGLAGVLLICGFGTKAGLMPMHAWLPDAYQESPGGFVALFAGVGTKIALLALARVLPPLMGAAPVLQVLLLAIAAVTMLLGIAAAFGQDDLRRMLGYSSVSQMGYIAMALAAGGAAGYTAGGYHMVSHGLIKALLFLCVAEVYQATGTARISELRGKPLPRYTGPIFLLASLGLGGVPPMPAFWSKFQVFTATASAGFTWAAVVAVLTSLLTITTLVRAGARVFLLRPGHEGEETVHDEATIRGDAPAHDMAAAAAMGPQGAAQATAFPWLLGLVVLVLFVTGVLPGWMTEFLGTAAQLLTAKGV